MEAFSAPLSFFSSDRIVSADLSSTSQSLSLLDPVWCWHSLSYFPFLSSCSTAPELLFGYFYDFSLSSCSCSSFIVSLILLDCPSEFSCSYCASFKQLFSILHQANLRPPFLGSVPGKLCSFGGVMCPWLSIFLTSCMAVFASEEAVTSSSLYWLALGRNTFVTPAGILKLSGTFSTNKAPPYFLFSHRRETLKKIRLLSILQSQAECASLLFALPSAMLNV